MDPKNKDISRMQKEHIQLCRTNPFTVAVEVWPLQTKTSPECKMNIINLGRIRHFTIAVEVWTLKANTSPECKMKI